MDLKKKMFCTKCVYHNCNRTSDSCTSMFRFPVHDPNRVAIWKLNSGNTYLYKLTPRQLRNRYLCADHFPQSSINQGAQRSRLIGRAVPFHYSDDTAAADQPHSPPSETLEVMPAIKVYKRKIRMPPMQTAETSRQSSDMSMFEGPIAFPTESQARTSAEPSISTKTPQPPQLAQSPRSKCSLCSKNFSGFVFACVQCNVRVCGACDARGAHARHYVLRAPSDGLEEQLTEVLSKVRAAVLSAGLAQPSHSPEPEDQPEAESEGEEEGDTDDEESEIILKSEIKEELYWSGSEDPLASSEYEEPYARDSTHSAAESQIVPAPDNVKQEPPGDGSVILDTGCDVTNTEQPSRRQSVTSNDSEDQPLAKRRRSNSTNTDGNALQDVMILKTEGNKKNTDPNSNPGSPTVAGSLTRRKKE